MRGSYKRRTRLGAVVVAGAMLLGACASDSEGGGSSSTGASTPDNEKVIQAGWVNEAQPAEAQGGTLQVTLASGIPGMDPTVVSHGLPTQGLVMTALYDSLLRYDPATGTYEGQLAEGVSANEDLTQWTLKLRPDVTFSDGTPLDAEAVVYSVKRMAKARGAAASYSAYVADFQTPDAQTVVFTLKEPLSNFDALLSAELGFPVSPTAAEADPDGFNTKPVGAGPFVLKSFDPTSELVLERNPSYALGQPPLDGIRFSWNVEQGANIDKLVAGQTDLTIGTSIPEIVRGIEAGKPTYTTLVPGFGMAVNSAAGRAFPGNDVRVRKAISLAIDRNAVDQRVNSGQGYIGPYFFPEGSPLHVDTDFGVANVEEARRLVEEVKAETGWDGSFTMLTPQPTDTALAYQAFLNAAGFNVQVEPVASYTDLAMRVAVSRDFDLAVYGMTIFPNTVYQTLSRSLSTGSPSNYASFSSPQLDALLAEMRVTDPAEQRALLERMAGIWAEEMPFITGGAGTYSLLTSEKVGGLEQTSLGLVLFGEAYKAS
jgi:peptide/nickel transport system substrate-binding protein